MKKWIVIVFLINALTAFAQDEKESKWELNGYIKYLHTYFALHDLNISLTDQLIHNRINVSYFPNDNWTLKVDFRNRLFYGEYVRFIPDYNEQITDINNDYFDLSWTIASDKAYVLHTMLDRAYINYSSGDWDVRLGRQRINWGIQTFWNPHDVFNTYSFTDFDYEERPGSDALLVRYYTGVASSVEVAVRAADHIAEGTIAGLWRFNKSNYDFQIPIGYTRQNFFTGIGWAGNIKTAGFKGEWAYYKGLVESEEDALVGSMGVDYIFSNNWYVQVGGMYNSLGNNDQAINNLLSFNLSSKNLYPYSTAVFTQLSIPISPLTNGSLSVIYSPVESQAMFINPGVSISIASNWDLDLIGQILFSKTDTFYSPVQALFMRIKYSY